MGQETFIHPYIVIGLIILVLWITSRRPGPTINNNPQAHAQVTTNTTIKGEGSGGLGIFAAAIVTVALLGLVAVVGLSALTAISGQQAVASQVASQQATIQQQLISGQAIEPERPYLLVLVLLAVGGFILWRIFRGIASTSPPPAPYQLQERPRSREIIDAPYRQLQPGAERYQIEAPRAREYARRGNDEDMPL